MGNDPLQRAAELVDADAQHIGVERHIDAGNQNVGTFSPGDLPPPFDFFLQCLQPATGAGDRVLRAAQVEVDDL